MSTTAAGKERQSHFAPTLTTWLSGQDWSERIITFDPSWFVVTIGTGVIVQVLTSFPYPAQWLRNLAYCFWASQRRPVRLPLSFSLYRFQILLIVLFVFFTVMSLLRLLLYPKVAINIMRDFTQTSFLGTIPISLDGIIVGIVLFYGDHSAAIWTALGFYWASVFLTLVVVSGSVFVMYGRQGEVELSNVTGVWLLTFIPMIVIASTGATISSHLDQRAGVAILVVSFMAWSLGMGMCYIVLAIYFWRLMKCKLPARDAIISCFVPVGPPGMAAYAIQNLAVGLAAHISKYQYTLGRAPEPSVSAQTIGAVAETIRWLGITTAFSLLGLATFFLVEAFASLWAKSPRSFNIGFWASVFPCGAYSQALCVLGSDVRNDGLKGFGAACVVCTVLLWLCCAVATFYKGVWRGKLFYAPGLQGWAEQQQLDKMRRSRGAVVVVEEHRSGHALATGAEQYDGDLVHILSGTDGTYAFSRRALDGDPA